MTCPDGGGVRFITRRHAVLYPPEFGPISTTRPGKRASTSFPMQRSEARELIMPFAQFQVVVLARDVPEDGLSAGTKAVILDVYDEGAAYEIEVFDGDETVFVGALPADALSGENAPPQPAAVIRTFAAERPALLRRIFDEASPWEHSQARADYIHLLPTHRLSRCPITGTIVERAIDTIELDGPWWDFRRPARPPSPHVATLVSLTGALALRYVVQTPFLVVPGPERPFVVPRLLDVDGVQAVLSWLPVGGHQGYPVCYFAPPPGPPLTIGRLNDWGRSSYLVQGREQIEEHEDHPWEAEWDYELAPWIAAGKLLWIAPGDPNLVLRSTVDDCPYLGLTGHRGITRMQNGTAWWPDDVTLG